MYPDGDEDSDNCASTVRKVPGRLMDELHKERLAPSRSRVNRRCDPALPGVPLTQKMLWED